MSHVIIVGTKLLWNQEPILSPSSNAPSQSQIILNSLSLPRPKLSTICLSSFSNLIVQSTWLNINSSRSFKRLLFLDLTEPSSTSKSLICSIFLFRQFCAAILSKSNKISFASLFCIYLVFSYLFHGFILLVKLGFIA